MLKLLASMVVLLLIGPLVLLAVVGLLLLSTALSRAPRRVRETFWCPVKRRMVTADFLVREGAPHPSDVVWCTAFADPEHITCKKRCLEFTDVLRGLSRGVFPRWALISGGTVTWRRPTGSPPPEKQNGGTALAA